MTYWSMNKAIFKNDVKVICIMHVLHRIQFMILMKANSDVFMEWENKIKSYAFNFFYMARVRNLYIIILMVMVTTHFTPPPKKKKMNEVNYYWKILTSCQSVVLSFFWDWVSQSYWNFSIFFFPVYTQRCQTREYPYNTAGTGQALWLRLCQSFK